MVFSVKTPNLLLLSFERMNKKLYNLLIFFTIRTVLICSFTELTTYNSPKTSCILMLSALIICLHHCSYALWSKQYQNVDDLDHHFLQ